MVRKIKHTPVPFKIGRMDAPGCVDGFAVTISDSRGWGLFSSMVFGENPKAHANARFIVRACNSLDGLLEACKNLLNEYCTLADNWTGEGVSEAERATRAAIADAEA